MRGRNIETGEMSVVRITPEGVGSGKERWQGVYNPSFDVTPADLISEYNFPLSRHGLELISRLRGDGEGCSRTEGRRE